MRIQTFTNKKGLIWGDDPLHVECDKSGVLKIGTNKIDVVADVSTPLPILCGGYSCPALATFTTEDGAIYNLRNVHIKAGRLTPPPEDVVTSMELMLQIEDLFRISTRLNERIEELSKIFDTNSLNFLIK